MNKHAYLIMAHGNWKILERLLLLLDDVRNDIYLHIDAHVANFPKEICDKPQYSKVNMVQSGNVFWADFSEMEATFRLMKAAKSNGGGGTPITIC